MDFIIFLVVIFGLIIGSFLNAVIYRLSLPGFSFWKNLGGRNRSYCPGCKHQLTWPDLIPVFSFLFLMGRCRYCHQKISWQYPIVEISTVLIFLIIFLATPDLAKPDNLINLIFLFYIASSLIVIFVYDLKYYLIPDSILFPAIAVSFFYRFFTSFEGQNFQFQIVNFENYLFAVLIASGFFLAIYLASRGRWMGFGDVKLAILLGLLLGFPNILVALFLSFFFGAIIGVLLLFFKKKGLKSEIPLAPFLIIGTGVALFWGSQIIHWYFQSFTFLK